MGSDTTKPSKPRHKFSFHGSNKHPPLFVPPSSVIAPNDESLNNTIRQANLGEVPGPLPVTRYVSPQKGPGDISAPTKTRHRGSAREALVIFLGSFLTVWLYGYFTGAYEIPYFSSITRSPEFQGGAQLVSSHPLLFGAASGLVLIGVIGGLFLRHRKKN